MSRGLLLYGRRSKQNRVVIVGNATNILVQSEEPQLGLALEEVIKKLNGSGIRGVCSLDEVYKPMISILDGWTGRGVHFIAWKSNDGHVALLASTSFYAFKDDIEGIRAFVEDGLCLKKGASHKCGKYKVTKVAHEGGDFHSMRVKISPKEGVHVVGYIGVGNNLAMAISGVSRVIPGR